MCGIVGYCGSNGVGNLVDALGFIRHRGPDDHGIFEDKVANIGLGHVRLSILDVSQFGHQPMLSADELVVLVFNGEIYNCNELREKLVLKGCSFRGTSDTEVLLNLYLIDGSSMLQQLNGIFSFALWDVKKQKMLIARDALGVKPFYYSVEKNNFVFSSEIKGMLPLLLSENNELDNISIQQYLSFLWSPGDRTAFSNIKKLLPGEAAWISNGEIKNKWSWYKLPIFKPRQDINTEKNVIKKVTSYLRQAVQRQMMSDVPVGAFLSGGLDSSAVVAFAREQNPDIPCFTIETTGKQEKGIVDDLPYAKKVAKHLNVPLHVVTVNSNQLADNLERMVTMLDEPLADPAPLNVLFISQLARDRGVKVLLSGAGGDDLFTGYRRHYAVQVDRWLNLIPRPLRIEAEKITNSLNVHNTFFRRLAKLFDGSILDGNERLVNYFRWTDKKIIQSLFLPDISIQLEKIDSAEPILNFLQPLSSDVSKLDRMLAIEQRFFLADHNLTYTDKMSMAAGVEVRVPFLDLDLVELAAKIPTKYKQRGREGKWVLKKAMEPYLPHDVIYRPKTGFGVPLRSWMKYELRELLNDTLSEESVRRRGVFDSQSVQKLIKNNFYGNVDASYTLFSLMCIEIWCRTFIDKKIDYNYVYSSVKQENSSYL